MPHGTKVKDFIDNGSWNLSKLTDSISENHLVQAILQVSIAANQPDCILWKPSKTGRFTFYSAWDLARCSREHIFTLSKLWHPCLPKKMSFLAWRLFFNWLPVETILQKRNFSLASKCICCNEVESLSHVFFTNKIATNIWQSFAEEFGIASTAFHTLQMAIKTWGHGVSTQGHIRHLIPVVILWALWEARNKALFEQREYTFISIRLRIMHLLLYMGKTELLHYKHWQGDLEVARRWGLVILRPARKPPKVLRWNKPPSNSIKVNTDGAFKEGKAGLGGLIRNAQGHCIAAIGKSTEGISALHAELLAIAYTLEWCKQNGHKNLLVETDSAAVMHMLNNQQGHWVLYPVMRSILQLLQSTDSTISLIFREQNHGADTVAKAALESQGSFLWLPPITNKWLKAILQLEAEDTPYIRG